MKKINICIMPTFMLVLLIGVVTFLNWLWITLDQFPVAGHHLMGHLPSVQVCRDMMGLGNHFRCYDNIFGIYQGGIRYPPLSFLVLGTIQLFIGRHGQAIQLVNTLYMAVALVCVFYIGKYILHARLGLFSAFILSSFPGVIAFSREYWVEFGLIAYNSLVILALFKTEYFSKTVNSVLFGIAVGLALLHKYEVIANITGPVLFVIAYSLFFAQPSIAKRTGCLKNITISVVTIFCVTSWWIIPYGKNMVDRIMFSATDAAQLRLSFTKNLTNYAECINSLLGNIYFGIFLLSLIFVIINSFKSRADKKVAKVALLLWFFIPYIVFTISRTKGSSHIFSILPVCALFIAFGVYSISIRPVRWAMVCLILFTGFSMQLSPFIQNPTRYFPFNITACVDHFCEQKLKWDHGGLNNPGIYAPRQIPAERVIVDTLSFIRKDAVGIPHPCVVSFYKDMEAGNVVFEYYNLIWDLGLLFPSAYQAFDDKQGLAFFDYIILETYNDEDIYSVLKPGYEKGEQRWFDNIVSKESLAQFELRARFIVPKTQVRVLVYRRRTKEIN